MRNKKIVILMGSFLGGLFFTFESLVFAAIPSFQGLNLPGSTALISDNGLAIAGTSDPWAWRWQNGIMTWIPADVLQYNRASGISADGSVVVGTIYGPTTNDSEAFRWENGVITKLGWFGSWHTSASAVSADGSLIVGNGKYGVNYQYNQAILWQNGSWSSLGELPGGDLFSSAYDISSDGSIVVGYSISDLGYEAFRWDGTMTGLGDLSGGSFGSVATAVSSDGSVIVGYGHSALGAEAFRWENGNWIGLGFLPGKTSSGAEDISANGSVIVGYSTGSGTTVPFIWDEENGMRNLQDILVNNYGLNLTGWTLQNATSISADGLTIAGYGVSPSGNIEPWIATIPEPATLLLLGVGGLLIRNKKTY